MTVFINCIECGKKVEVPNFRTKMCSDCSRNKRLLGYKKYKIANKEKIVEYNKQWKSENKENVSAYNKKYAKENRETIQKRNTQREKVKRHTDSKYKMQIVIRNRFRKFYTGERKRHECVGIPIEKFINWIEIQFTGDMNWTNHGTLWHIDHVVPCIWFDFEIESDRKICFHWSNMRPLLAKRNMSRKGCSISELLLQEIRAKNFLPDTNFKPLTTKLFEKLNSGKR